MKKRKERCLGVACLGAAVLGSGTADGATVIFRDGLAGYTGTDDTWFSNRTFGGENMGLPTVNYIRTAQFGTPPDFADGANQQALVRFNDIFGIGAGQIPQGSTVTSATLRLHVPTDVQYSDGEANAVYQMLVDWAETDAFDAPQWAGGAGGHINRDGIEAAAIAADDSTSYAVNNVVPVNTTMDFDVTGIVQAWAANPTVNYGFLLQSLGLSGGNGFFMASSEYAGADGVQARPTLVVEGDFPGNVFTMTVNRNSGEVRIINDTGAPVTSLLGYVIQSDAGALDQTNWLTVADNYDQSGGGPIDLNDNWTVVSDPNSHHDLSEFEFDGGDGGVLPDGISLNLGSVWIQSPVEDLEVVLVRTDGSELNVEVNFVGNNGSPFAPGDLNFDGVISASDWPTFRDNHLVDMTGLTGPQAYQLGDLDGDFDNDEVDFAIFKQLFDDAIGPGAFNAMLSGVPEPSSAVIVIGISMALIALRRRS